MKRACMWAEQSGAGHGRERLYALMSPLHPSIVSSAIGDMRMFAPTSIQPVSAMSQKPPRRDIRCN